MERYKLGTVIICLVFCDFIATSIETSTQISEQDLNDIVEKLNRIKINKCCEENESMIDDRCTHLQETNTTRWSPVFTNENGKDNIQVNYQFVVGQPACDNTQQWSIYHLPNSSDKLVLLPNGMLRHYVEQGRYPEPVIEDHSSRVGIFGRLNEPPPPHPEEDTEPHFYDYEQGKYCMEKVTDSRNNQTAMYALVCVPEIIVNWSDTDFFMKKLLNPLCHAIGLVCFLLVAIIYFILPTLRDLNGNIVTTICICLIISQTADLVRIFTDFSSHISFIVADITMYITLLAAFFWLNSMGYYIWKTFKSRNVFLRVTDGRKYCYYSCYAWGLTILMGTLAVFAHYLLDTGDSTKKHGRHAANSYITNGDQETIGWLGIAVFFTPVAFTVVINIFFYVTTLKVINRMNTYGRIHHKLKHNFDMFLMIFLIMTITWLFLLLSWLKMDGLMYSHIIVNALQGPLMLYVCVVRQKHVVFLLRKSCCYSEPLPTSDWGDEMTQMNGGSY